MKAKKVNQALRRWAVEQAMKWPTIMTCGGSQGMLGGHSSPVYSDADVIGRAKKLEDFVTGNA